MKITLTAKADNQFQSISIGELPFLIGRDEAPFTELVHQSQRMSKAVYHISRRHAKLYQEGNKIRIRDLGSKNGTKVNGRKVGSKPVELQNGDLIRITKTFEYTVKIEQDIPEIKQIPLSLTLIPLDPQSGLSQIDISAYPFNIGRSEDSFRIYESTRPDQTGSLSRKHARITYQDNQIFIEDLGSTNGTTLSGVTIGQTPKPIHHGDQISFGQFFAYNVRLISEDVEETIALHSETIEEADRKVFPDYSNSKIASVGVMEAQKQNPIDEITPPPPPKSGKNMVYISATHSKDAPPEQAAEVKSTCQSEAFVANDTPVTNDEADKQSGTVYMSSATQFLKIMTSEEKQKSTNKDASGKTEGNKPPPSASGSKISRILGVAKEIFGTLSATSVQSKKRKWYYIAFAVVLTTVALWRVVVYRMPEQKLKRLMASGQYIEYVKFSSQVLDKNPGKEEIRQAATEALMRASLADFTKALKNGRIDSAKAIIGSYTAFTSNNPEAIKTLQLFSWIVDLENYFIQNDPDQPINLFRDEVIIEPMVSQWDANEDDYRFIMDQMVQRSEAFKPMRGIVYHHLNVLELKTIYFDSVKELNRTIQTKIDGGRNEEILTAIDEYKRKHPNVEGLLELREEAENFQNLDQLIRRRDVVQLATFFNDIEFQTPVFKQKVQDLQKNILPAPEFGLQMSAAGQAWAGGKTEQAFTILQGITKERWGDIAETKLNHYRQVVALVDKVNNSKGSPEHSANLLTLRRVLNPEEDMFYAQLVEGDFAGLRDQELQRSQVLMDKASQVWGDYLKSGRITGLLRLESTVSKNFTLRAKQLKTCFDNSRAGVHIYKSLDIQLPDKWERLNTDITDEVIAQRLRIEDLAGVLGQEVSTAKLALLPLP